MCKQVHIVTVNGCQKATRVTQRRTKATLNVARTHACEVLGRRIDEQIAKIVEPQEPPRGACPTTYGASVRNRTIADTTEERVIRNTVGSAVANFTTCSTL